MARFNFGGALTDFAIIPPSGQANAVKSQPNVTNGAVYAARTGGSPLTDLLDSLGAATTVVKTDSDGFVQRFQGPNGVTDLWVDLGSGVRYKIRTTDAAFTASGAVGALASSNGVTGGGVADDTAAMNTFLTSCATLGVPAILDPLSTVLIASIAGVVIPTNTRLNLNGATIKNAINDPNGRLLHIEGVSNATVYGGVLDGDKASYAPVTEQRHNIRIVNSSNVTLRDLRSINAKGDGVYVGDQISGYSSNVYMENVTCDSNYRQGMSISHVDGLYAFGCHFNNTAGTFPYSGVDIEPNSASVVCSDIKFTACEFTGNQYAGLLVSLQSAPTARQGGIDVIGCSLNGNTENGLNLRDVTDFRMVGGEIRLNGKAGALVMNGYGTLSTDISLDTVTIGANGFDGISVTSAEQVIGMLVQGCAFVGNGTVTTNTYSGINLAPLAGTKHIRLIGNRFDGSSQKYGVQTSANVSNLTMVGNIYGTLGTANTSLGDDTATRYILDRGQVAFHKQMYQASSGTTLWELYATGDTVARVAARTDGALTFSSGSAAQDTILQRTGVSVLSLGADDSLKTGQNVTASRPTASTVGKGAQFYDTTLNKPIWSDGTNWKDAAGNTV